MAERPIRNHVVIAHASVRRETDPVAHRTFWSDTLTGAIELELETLDPVIVGTGAYALSEGGLARQAMRSAGELVVPGTSIKGTCRQIHEVLTSSGTPFDTDEALHFAEDAEGRPDPLSPELLSASSALFGTLGYRGRVSFDDARSRDPLEPEIVELSVAYPPPEHPEEVGRRFYGVLPEEVARDRPITAVAIPKGARLVTRLRFWNVEEAELGGVLSSLGVGPSLHRGDDGFAPRLGGGKYDGHGRVLVHPRRYLLREAMPARERSWVEGEEAEKFFKGCLEKLGRDRPDGFRQLEKLFEKGKGS